MSLSVVESTLKQQPEISATFGSLFCITSRANFCSRGTSGRT